MTSEMAFGMVFCIIVVGMILAKSNNDTTPPWLVGAILSVLGIVGLVAMLITIPIARNDVFSQIKSYESTIRTLERARITNINSIENAAIQQEIIKVNSWLAKTKYSNTKIGDWWIPDAIMDLKEIQ